MSNKKIFENIFSLSVLQIIKYILPLILIPYLLRIIGVEKFGLLAFVMTLIIFFRVFVEYGFNLVSSKRISQNKHNHKRIELIFSSTIISKFLLLIICFIFLNILILFVDRFYEYWYLYYISFGIVIGEALFPLWYFQGIQEMKISTIINISFKIFFTIITFIYVKEENDFILVAIFETLGYLLAGIFSLFYIKNKYNLKFYFIKFRYIKKELVNGFHIFLSRSTVLLYTYLNILILGFLTNNSIVGYFSIAEKITNALRGLTGPINQAIYPVLAKLYKSNQEMFSKKAHSYMIYQWILLFLFTFLLLIFSKNIIILINGSYIKEIEEILNILAFSIILGMGGYFSQLLVIMKKNKFLSIITMKTAFLNLILVFPSIYFFETQGLAFTFLIIQFYQLYLQIKINKNIILYKGIK